MKAFLFMVLFLTIHGCCECTEGGQFAKALEFKRAYNSPALASNNYASTPVAPEPNQQYENIQSQAYAKAAAMKNVMEHKYDTGTDKSRQTIQYAQVGGYQAYGNSSVMENDIAHKYDSTTLSRLETKDPNNYEAGKWQQTGHYVQIGPPTPEKSSGLKNVNQHKTDSTTLNKKGTKDPHLSTGTVKPLDAGQSAKDHNQAINSGLKENNEENSKEMCSSQSKKEKKKKRKESKKRDKKRSKKKDKKENSAVKEEEF